MNRLLMVLLAASFAFAAIAAISGNGPRDAAADRAAPATPAPGNGAMTRPLRSHDRAVIVPAGARANLIC